MFTKEQADAIMEMQAEAATAAAEGRSSSASHFSKDHETASVGVATTYFYDVELTSHHVLQAIGWWRWMGPGVILGMMLLQTQWKRNLSKRVMAAVMGATLAAAPDTTWIPLLTTVLHTRTAYPYLVVLPHCIMACATYRRAHHRHGNGPDHDYLQSLVGSFFLYGFGGSIVSDVLMGLPVTALSHPRILPCHLLGWILVHHSPGDVVYQNLNGFGTNTTTTATLWGYLVTSMEAVDAVTTPMGRVSRGARELRHRTIAPVVAGLLAGVGGGTLRYLAHEPGVTPGALEHAFWKTLGYSTLWWYLAVYRCDHGFAVDDESEEEYWEEWNHCDSYNGSDLARVILVGAHAAWTLLVEMGMARGHPFVWMCKKLFLEGGARLCSIMGWGPQEDDDEYEGDSDKKND
jgi:uncharacterized membrane protein YeiH